MVYAIIFFRLFSLYLPYAVPFRYFFFFSQSEISDILHRNNIHACTHISSRTTNVRNKYMQASFFIFFIFFISRNKTPNTRRADTAENNITRKPHTRKSNIVSGEAEKKCIRRYYTCVSRGQTNSSSRN